MCDWYTTRSAHTAIHVPGKTEVSCFIFCETSFSTISGIVLADASKPINKMETIKPTSVIDAKILNHNILVGR